MTQEQIEQIAQIAVGLYGHVWLELPEHSKAIWREAVRHEPTIFREPGVAQSPIEKCAEEAKELWQKRVELEETPAPLEKKPKGKNKE